MTLMSRIAAVLIFSLAYPSYADIDAPSGRYVLEDTHGYITVSYSHLGFSTPHVGFNSFDATLEFDADAPAEQHAQRGRGRHQRRQPRA